MSKPLTTGKIAKYCHVDVKTVTKWIKDGKLKAYQLPSGDNRVEQKNLIQFLKEYNIPVPDELTTAKEDYHILIVDDDHLMAPLVKRLLIDEPVKIEAAFDGFEAGLKVKSFNPDLVILDLRMPGLDGFSVAESLKNNDANADIKILIVSGYVDEAAQQRLETIGVDAILKKPFDNRQFINTVKKLAHLS